MDRWDAAALLLVPISGEEGATAAPVVVVEARYEAGWKLCGAGTEVGVPKRELYWWCMFFLYNKTGSSSL